MRPRGAASIVASPLLVGATTTLVVVVAVFLAYNANNGLPFVPTREYHAQLDSGSNLVEGNDVRAGGFRVGVVERLEPATLPDGRTIAVATLKLNRKTGDVPVDSRLKVRPRSALGLKYLELTRGRSRRELSDGDTIPVARTSPQVQFDDVNKLFDARTRPAAQENLGEFGDAFAGRGGDLNRAVAALPPLFGHLEPVAANLADPDTQLGRLFRELGDAARVVAPLAEVNARLFSDMATTFEAIARDPAALRATIERSPPTIDVTTRSLRVQRPFLEDTADFSSDLRVATRELRAALPDLDAALVTGAPVLRRTVPMNRALGGVFGALRDLAAAPATSAALRGLTATVTTLNPQLRFLGPYQTVCNYWNYFWTYAAEHLSEPDTTGTTQRALLNSGSGHTNDLSHAGAYEGAHGQDYEDLPAPAKARGDAMFLQGASTGAAVNDDGTADCENGQRGFLHRASTFVPERDLRGEPYLVTTDPHTPGSQGPTYKGRARVPDGQTFSRENETGAQLDRAHTTGKYGG